jgi:hypothetical protein
MSYRTAAKPPAPPRPTDADLVANLRLCEHAHGRELRLDWCRGRRRPVTRGPAGGSLEGMPLASAAFVWVSFTLHGEASTATRARLVNRWLCLDAAREIARRASWVAIATSDGMNWQWGGSS